MKQNLLIVIGLLVLVVLVTGFCVFMRKKEQYVDRTEYLDTDNYDISNSDINNSGINNSDNIELVDNEDVRVFGSGPGLYGSGRHTSEGYGGW
jgi:hypothetical protein